MALRDPASGTDATVPASVGRAPAGPYRGLNPVTKLVLALVEALLAFAVGGWLGPLLALALVIGSAFVARVGRGLLPFVLAILPLVASIVLINTFIYPGATDVIARVGPFDATWTGLTVALQAMLRVAALALSVAVLVLTTDPSDLVDELEARGLGRRAAFVIGSAVRTIPGTVERGREIADAQRARGLDTEGRIRGRLRGVLPLAAPLVLSALTEVEERTMALEARAFSAPGRRTVLRRLPDSGRQRAGRWLAVVGALALVGVTASGLVELP